MDQIQVLRDENRRLKHAVEELSILHELARTIGASLDPQEIIGAIVQKSLRADPRFSGMKWDESIRSLLCGPLTIKSELKGVLTVYNKKGGVKFTDDDQCLLAIIAAQSVGGDQFDFIPIEKHGRRKVCYIVLRHS